MKKSHLALYAVGGYILYRTLQKNGGLSGLGDPRMEFINKLGSMADSLNPSQDLGVTAFHGVSLTDNSVHGITEEMNSAQFRKYQQINKFVDTFIIEGFKNRKQLQTGAPTGFEGIGASMAQLALTATDSALSAGERYQAGLQLAQQVQAMKNVAGAVNAAAKVKNEVAAIATAAGDAISNAFNGSVQSFQQARAQQAQSDISSFGAQGPGGAAGVEGPSGSLMPAHTPSKVVPWLAQVQQQYPLMPAKLQMELAKSRARNDSRAPQDVRDWISSTIGYGSTGHTTPKKDWLGQVQKNFPAMPAHLQEQYAHFLQKTAPKIKNPMDYNPAGMPLSVSSWLKTHDAEGNPVTPPQAWSSTGPSGSGSKWTQPSEPQIPPHSTQRHQLPGGPIASSQPPQNPFAPLPQVNTGVTAPNIQAPQAPTSPSFEQQFEQWRDQSNQITAQDWGLPSQLATPDSQMFTEPQPPPPPPLDETTMTPPQTPGDGASFQWNTNAPPPPDSFSGPSGFTPPGPLTIDVNAAQNAAVIQNGPGATVGGGSLTSEQSFDLGLEGMPYY